MSKYILCSISALLAAVPNSALAQSSSQLSGPISAGVDGKVTFNPSTSDAASINIPQGVAPSAPSDGDIWTTDIGLFSRIGGKTRQFLDSVSPLSAQFAISGSSDHDYRANILYIPSDTVSVGSNFVVGQFTSSLFGGAGVTGGRVLGDFQLYQVSPTSINNLNRNYVALQAVVNNQVSDTGAPGNERGAYFGFSAAFRCAGTNLLECTGGEINSFAQSGSSIKYKNLWSLVGGGSEDSVKGHVWDTMLAFSDQPGSVGHDSAILIGPMNGQFPIATNGTLIKVDGGSYTAANGIDLSSMNLTGYILNGRTATISGSGYYTGTGQTLSGNTPPIIFNDKSGASSLKNWRVIPAAGILHIQAGDDTLATFTDAYAITESAGGVQQHAWYTSTQAGSPVLAAALTGSSLSMNVPVKLGGYAVSALPACNSALLGALVYARDLTSVVYNAVPTGGGSGVAPVFCNGSNWTIH